jgi:hypothetical protein
MAITVFWNVKKFSLEKFTAFCPEDGVTLLWGYMATFSRRLQYLRPIKRWRYVITCLFNLLLPSTSEVQISILVLSVIFTI